jgi:SynChlorMet cassette radical SAM/SPASM protein ScmE
MKTPKSVEIAITNRCNLHCRYCSYFESPTQVENELSTEEWLAFFEELNRCAVMDVCLQGGEPFIRDDLPLLLEGIVKNRMRFSLLTNGTLVTDDIARYIANTGRCDSVQVSIDGATRKTHEACRGKGNFDRAVNGLKILQKHGVNVTVRVTIHKHNVDDLENIARFLLEELHLPGFSTNSASYLGLCRQFSESVQLSTEERIRAMKSLRELKEKYNGRISAQAGPLAEAEYWAKMIADTEKQKPGNNGEGFLTSCGGVFSKLAVRSDGIMVPCILMSHLELGKINDDSLKETWWNHPEINRLRSRRAIPLSEFEFCKDCQYISHCRGNCPAIAYTETGMENHPSPDACLREFLKNGGEVPNVHC